MREGRHPSRLLVEHHGQRRMEGKKKKNLIIVFSPRERHFIIAFHFLSSFRDDNYYSITSSLKREGEREK